MGQGGVIVLINGTKYVWRRVSEHSYQMNHWNGQFPEIISAGEYCEIYVEWDQEIFKCHGDDSGEVRYELSGLNNSFEIQARGRPEFHIQVEFNNLSNLGNGLVNLNWKHDGHMIFILSGSDSRFISTGMNGCAESWMNDYLKELGSKTLKEISIAGSHDSGMSCSNDGTAFGTERFTKTQHCDILGQLNIGVRYFDIRPIIGGGDFFTGHYSYISFVGGFQGARGQSIESIISQINSFTDGRKELIILRISHTFNTDVGNSCYREFDEDEWGRFFFEMSRLKNLYDANSNFVSLINLPLQDIIRDRSAVCVVVDNKVVLGDLEHRGFFHANEFNTYDEYSNTNNFDDMANDQIRKMNEGHNYFLLSWTLTPQSEDIVIIDSSIEKLASLANDNLFRILGKGGNIFRMTKYPNIILEDYIDTTAAAMALAINIA